MTFRLLGGAPFIGSAVCSALVGEAGAQVLNVDKLAYAAKLRFAEADRRLSRYGLRRADISSLPNASTGQKS
jgi:dTDP-glucose 4,6-dehydratase